MTNAKPTIRGRITIEQQNKIIELSKIKDRPEIAEDVGTSEKTVYNYQKKLNII